MNPFQQMQNAAGNLLGGLAGAGQAQGLQQNTMPTTIPWNQQIQGWQYPVYTTDHLYRTIADLAADNVRLRDELERIKNTKMWLTGDGSVPPTEAPSGAP